ncbi:MULTISPECIES: hypothetical protein [unclassified Streptomyces]
MKASADSTVDASSRLAPALPAETAAYATMVSRPGRVGRSAAGGSPPAG